MAFWSTNIEPLQKRNFEVIIGTTGVSFLAKTADKPTMETDVNEYQLINQIYKYPTIVKWNDINIKFVDTVEKSVSKQLYDLMSQGTRDLGDWFNKHGGAVGPLTKNRTPMESAPDGTLQPAASGEITGRFEIDVIGYNSNKQVVSKWTLKNAFIRSINFGDYDYSSDDFVEVDVTISYDYADLETIIRGTPGSKTAAVTVEDLDDLYGESILKEDGTVLTTAGQSFPDE